MAGPGEQGTYDDGGVSSPGWMAAATRAFRAGWQRRRPGLFGPVGGGSCLAPVGGGGALRPVPPRLGGAVAPPGLGGAATCRPLLGLGGGGAGLLHPRPLLGGAGLPPPPLGQRWLGRGC
jgi:hypothetical protein